MKLVDIKMRKLLTILAVGALFTACQTSSTETGGHDHDEHAEEVFLTARKVKELGVRLDTLNYRTFEGIVYTNGRLEVPPQSVATITSMLGGNISNILHIEGTDIKKGQVLAYLQHPDYITLQTEYLKAFHQNKFLTSEFDRQKKLGEAEIGAKKDFQRIESELMINRAELKGYEAQLLLLQLNLSRIQNGDFYNQIPVSSPIDGSIEEINVQLGQYVDAQTKLFRIVNAQHVHADFMVFENDVMAVRVGQRVKFTVGNSPQEFNATIISVGKQFEDTPKALHIHADIDGGDERNFNFIAGMYLKGEIHTESVAEAAVPESAVVAEDGKDYIFYVQKEPQGEQDEYQFGMVEVKETRRENDWIAIQILGELPKNAQIVQDGAYYLISEMKKGELEDEH